LSKRSYYSTLIKDKGIVANQCAFYFYKYRKKDNRNLNICKSGFIDCVKD